MRDVSSRRCHHIPGFHFPLTSPEEPLRNCQPVNGNFSTKCALWPALVCSRDYSGVAALLHFDRPIWAMG